MTDPGAAKRIGVLGHVGNGNLGDEAIIAAVIDNIKRRYPSAEICAITSNPEDTRERHNIVAFPLRRTDKSMESAKPRDLDQVGTQNRQFSSTLLAQVKSSLKAISWAYVLLKRIQKLWQVSVACLKEPIFLFRCYRNMKGVDLLIIAGSSQLIDYVAGGPWGHPYTIFKWALIARAQKTKIAFVSCGAGPIRSSLGRFFIRSSLSLADYRSCRDDVSSKCLAQLGNLGRIPVFPDLVYSLRIKESSADAATPIAQSVVGINPLHFADPQYWVGGSARSYEIYIRTLADFSLWLIQRGHSVLFFPTQLRADPPAIEDVRKLMTRSSIADVEKHIITCPVHSFDELTSAISTTDMIVATRFHGVVLSFILNKPVLGIAYADKTNDLMEQLGQGEFALDIMNLELRSLQGRFIALETQKPTIKKRLAQRIPALVQALDAQYDQVLGLLEPIRL
jgi:polysaccharide pyruvyl transferase WcaK-like protein